MVVVMVILFFLQRVVRGDTVAQHDNHYRDFYRDYR